MPGSAIHPCPCSKTHLLKPTYMHVLPALHQSGIWAPAASVHSCVIIKTGALRGRHSFPASQLPPRKCFQQHSNTPRGPSASIHRGAWLSLHISACSCIVSELKRQSQMLAWLVSLPTSWAQEFSQESKGLYPAALNHPSQLSTTSNCSLQVEYGKHINFPTKTEDTGHMIPLHAINQKVFWI